MRAACGGVLLAAALAAQTPKFEVVSIRVVPPNTPPTMRTVDFTAVQPGGRYVDSRTGLFSMIAFAFQVKDASNRLLGLPKWARETSYAVAAKAGDGSAAPSPAENLRQVRLMLRAMLADRFHLQIHSETREETIYRVEVAKGGFKLQEVGAPVPPEKEGFVGLAMSNVDGRLIGKKSTVAGLIRAIAPHIKTPLVDASGLNGYYDFDIKWSVPEPPGYTSSASFGAEGMALLASTLQERFGLRLVKATGPVEYWVVDHVEPPTGN